MATTGYAILDRARGTTTPFTAPDTTSTSPVWSPDDRRVVYSLLRDGAYDLYIKEVKPGGREERLLHTSGMKAAQSWSRDGKTILFNAAAQTGIDLWTIAATPGATPQVFAGGGGDQCCGKFSPDGNWVAYVSSEEGQPEVFVRPFGRPGESMRVSKDGGAAPEWHTGGRELYFLNLENRLMSVAVTFTGGTLKAGAPVALFQINNRRLKPGSQLRVSGDSPYAVSGDRFLVTDNEPDPRASAINLLLNWTPPRPR